MEFFKRFNDYSCVESRDPDIDELYHFTKSVEAVKNIVTGCFWATDIRDFSGNGEDENEGYLILRQILELIYDVDISTASLVEDIIGTKDSMNDFFDKHETYLISTCTSKDSTYMWSQYAGKDGYKIVLDKKELLNSLYIILKNGEIRDDIFKHAKILYNYEKQIDIIKKEYQGLIENKDICLRDRDNVDYILQHLMYVGNFYKKDDKNYLQEDEYRILINTESHGKIDIDEGLPERRWNPYNNKHYVEIRFSPKAIKKIVCASKRAEEVIKNENLDIDIEIRNTGV